MVISLRTYLIACPLVFLAGLVDAISGGGGLISLPAYLLAGLPVHNAIATNKLSSACGTAVATGRFIRNGFVNWKIGIPSVIAAVAASSVGARVSLMIPERTLVLILIAVLPVAAFLVLNRHLFGSVPDTDEEPDRKTYLTAVIAALVVGFYDGLYGPGTGTFLIIAFTVFAKLGIRKANAQTKVINLTTNITSLVVFFLHGQILFPLGIPAGICNMLGGYIGAGLMMKNGTRIVRPCIILVLVLLGAKILTDYVF